MAMPAEGLPLRRRNPAPEPHVLSSDRPPDAARRQIMKHVIRVIALFAALSAPAVAQTVAPEPAPAAQQAVPADKVGPPLHEKQTPTSKIEHAETTGASPKELKPSHGDDAVNPGKLEKGAPSR
jgi:hypothetical protein